MCMGLWARAPHPPVHRQSVKFFLFVPLQIFGPESSGKTTLALHAIAEAQKAGKACVFIDAEHALDKQYAQVGPGKRRVVMGVKKDQQGRHASLCGGDKTQPCGLPPSPLLLSLQVHGVMDHGPTNILPGPSPCPLLLLQALGVDTRTLMLVQPDCGEQALEVADQLARCGEIGMIVVDSVSALVPR